MGRVIDYISELVLAPKSWGKTYYLLGRARYLAQHDSIRSVFLIDPPESCSGIGEVFRNPEQYRQRFATRGTLPRVAVWRLGLEPGPYSWPLRTAIDIGETAVLVDEAQLFAPSRRGVLLPELAQIAAMGRHLTNAAGDVCRVHWIAATQRPTALDTGLRDHATTVICGQFRAAAAREWVRKEVDEEALERLDRLAEHEWACIAPRGARVPAIVRG